MPCPFDSGHSCDWDDVGSIEEVEPGKKHALFGLGRVPAAASASRFHFQVRFRLRFERSKLSGLMHKTYSTSLSFPSLMTKKSKVEG